MTLRWITRIPNIGPASKVLLLGPPPGIQVAAVRCSLSPSTEGKYVGRVDLPGLAAPCRTGDCAHEVMVACAMAVEAWVKQAGLGGES